MTPPVPRGPVVAKQVRLAAIRIGDHLPVGTHRIETCGHIVDQGTIRVTADGGKADQVLQNFGGG
jgi:hypothetical protein